MGRKKKELSFIECLLKIKRAGIEKSQPINSKVTELEGAETLSERIDKILGLLNKEERKATDMLFFVMYDIEDDKVRYQVAKYLLANGCNRIQHSIFLADLSSEKYNKIRTDLTEVQSFYENHDSIIIVPLSVDHLKSMHVIGKNIDIDIVMHNKNTMFF